MFYLMNGRASIRFLLFAKDSVIELWFTSSVIILNDVRKRYQFFSDKIILFIYYIAQCIQ